MLRPLPFAQYSFSCYLRLMKIFAGLTMQRTYYSSSGRVTSIEHRFDVLDFPERDSVPRQEVLARMLDKMPADVRSGAIIFFSADSPEIESPGTGAYDEAAAADATADAIVAEMVSLKNDLTITLAGVADRYAVGEVIKAIDNRIATYKRGE